MNEITVDPMALLFEVELKAAAVRCGNCGKRGFTVVGDNIQGRFEDHVFTCAPELQCIRCRIAGTQIMKFANPVFIY